MPSTHAQRFDRTLNFSDVTADRIAQTVPEASGNEKEVEFGDFDHDGDGDFDLYLGNAPSNSQDTMYFNDADGFFVGVTNTHVPPDADYTDDVAAVDINGDGLIDLLVINGTVNDNWVYYSNLGGASRPATNDYLLEALSRN